MCFESTLFVGYFHPSLRANASRCVPEVVVVMVIWKFAGFMLGGILCESEEQVKRQKTLNNIKKEYEGNYGAL